MEKSVMMKAVKDALHGELNDNDRRIDTCEVVWDKLFSGGSALSDDADAIMTKLFDECLDELLTKVNTCLEEQPIKVCLTVKEAILKHFGEGKTYYHPKIVEFANSDDKMLGIEVDSCCGCDILANVYRIASEVSQTGAIEAHAVLWDELHEITNTIYYG